MIFQKNQSNFFTSRILNGKWTEIKSEPLTYKKSYREENRETPVTDLRECQAAISINKRWIEELSHRWGVVSKVPYQIDLTHFNKKKIVQIFSSLSEKIVWMRSDRTKFNIESFMWNVTLRFLTGQTSTLKFIVI